MLLCSSSSGGPVALLANCIGRWSSGRLPTKTWMHSQLRLHTLDFHTHCFLWLRIAIIACGSFTRLNCFCLCRAFLLQLSFFVGFFEVSFLLTSALALLASLFFQPLIGLRLGQRHLAKFSSSVTSGGSSTFSSKTSPGSAEETSGGSSTSSQSPMAAEEKLGLVSKGRHCT